MKKRVLHILALLMVVAVAFSFAGCNRNGFDASLYVKGILDVTYKDDSTDYLKMVDDTADNAHEMYLSGLDTEAEYFASVYSIETLSDETRQAIVSMYQEIYQHSNYEVKSANVTDSGYTVEVLIR